MKAIILAAGTGSRLRPLTNKIPKCLAKLNGFSILEHEIDIISSHGVTKYIIATGPFEHQIKDLVNNKYPKFQFTYVNNPKFESTNYIYSLWLCKKQIDDDIILLHGDMVFDEILIKKLLQSEHKNAVLVNSRKEVPIKDFKGRIVNKRVKEIGVNVFGNNARFLAPVYKFSKEDMTKWINKIEKYVKNGKLNVYAENAFNEISDKIELIPVYYSNEFCMEIDTYEDLEIAKKYFSGKIIK